MAMIRKNLNIFKKKLTRNYRDYGFFVCSKKTVDYLTKPVYDKTKVVLFKTNLQDIYEKKSYDNNFDYKSVKPKNAHILKQIEEMEEWLEGKLELSLGKKKLCLAALKNNKVIGFYLISFNDIYLPLLYPKVLLKDDEAFGEQITVQKNYRRKGLATEMRSLAYMELKRRGINTIYSTALTDNHASLKSIKKGGGKKIGQIH